MSGPLDRPHVWLPGSIHPPLLLLHGTGGNEHELLPLRDHLAPAAAVLSVRGSVLERGMPRFFKRLAEGVFDEDDLRFRVDDLAEFVHAAESRYGVVPGSWAAIGFSNGANIASAMLLRRPPALAAAVLLAAMVPFREPPQADLHGKRIAVVNGRNDPMADPEQTRTLVEQFRTRGATVVELPHDYGHTIDPRQLSTMSRFVQGIGTEGETG